MINNNTFLVKVRDSFNNLFKKEPINAEPANRKERRKKYSTTSRSKNGHGKGKHELGHVRTFGTFRPIRENGL